MPVESAADRAALFSADDFGEAALYTPPGGGVAVPCTILYDRGRGANPDYEIPLDDRGGGMRAAIARQRATINADDVAVVATGGTLVPGTIVNGLFVPGPDTLKIVGRPNLEETGAIWTVDLQKL
jgi:hypothetical protein